MSFANATHRLRTSRPQNLTREQKTFKNAWLRLHSKPIKGTYATDAVHWTCGCGAQKYHSHLLCKHLVQSVPFPDNDWWPTALRKHTAPFYDVPGTGASSEAFGHAKMKGRYYWIARMPGTPPMIPQTPKKDRTVLGSSRMVSSFPKESTVVSEYVIGERAISGKRRRGSIIAPTPCTNER